MSTLKSVQATMKADTF